MGYYNPFNELYFNETSKHIHARSLRSSFWQKMKDTFFVFAGAGLSSEFKDKESHLGLLDYATLGISSLISTGYIKLVRYFMEKNVPLIYYIFPIIIPLIVFLISNAAKYSVAAIFTLVLSPIVLVTHLVLTDTRSIQNVNNLRLIESHFEGQKDSWENELTLGKMLADNDLSFEDIEVSYVSAVLNPYHPPYLPIWRRDNVPISSSGGSTIFYIPMDDTYINTNKTSLDAMLALNVGKFSSLFNSIPDEKYKNHFPDEVGNVENDSLQANALRC